MGGAPSPNVVQGFLCSVTRSRALQVCSDSLSDPHLVGGYRGCHRGIRFTRRDTGEPRARLLELTPVGLQDNKTKSKWRDFMARGCRAKGVHGLYRARELWARRQGR